MKEEILIECMAFIVALAVSAYFWMFSEYRRLLRRHRKTIDEYNALVRKHNALLEDVKSSKTFYQYIHYRDVVVKN